MKLTKAMVRPLLSLAGYAALTALAFMTARGAAPGAPEWFMDAYILGTMVHILGWDVVRELEKRRVAP